MKPIGPLMREHRLIDRVIVRMKVELESLKSNGSLDSDFLKATLDFLKMYADRTHFGKEDEILFKSLDAKPLIPEHRSILARLREDHRTGRKLVKDLEAAGNSAESVILYLDKLVTLYPAHTELEDKHFFFPILSYYTNQEMDMMLHAFWEYDRKLIHEEYENLVSSLEAK